MHQINKPNRLTKKDTCSKSGAQKKKRNVTCRNCAKRGSDIEKNLQTTKGAKVNNLTTEMNEGMIGTIAKISQAV